MKSTLALLMGLVLAAGSSMALAQGKPEAKPAPAAVAAAGDVTTSQAMAEVLKRASGALAIVKITLGDEIFGKQDVAGLAMCVAISADGKAQLITMVLDPRVQADMVKKVEVIVPGVDAPLSAKFIAVDPETSISFISVEDTAMYGGWKKLDFADRSDLAIGKQVLSVGLLDQQLGFEKYVGVAYVSAKLRVPTNLIYVTGGQLTAVGSPVFSEDGKAIGIVQQQLPTEVTIGAQGRTAPVSMRQSKETSYFVPVEDFGAVIKNPPVAGKRLPWIGVVNFSLVDQTVFPVKVPAVMIGKIMPGSPAAAQGLVGGEIITGFAVAGEGAKPKPLEKLATPELTMLNFVRQLMRVPVGSKVILDVLNKDLKPMVVEVATEATPTRPDEAKKAFAKNLGLLVREKVALDEILDATPTAKEKGLYVIGMTQKGAAAEAGMKTDPSDLVIKVNGQDVTTCDQFTKLIDGFITSNPGKPVIVIVRSGEQNKSFSLMPQEVRQ